MKENILHYYIDLLRSDNFEKRKIEETELCIKALQNSLNTMKLSRNHRVCKEDFSKLDFGTISFSDIKFSSNAHDGCVFVDSKINELSFICGHYYRIQKMECTESGNWMLSYDGNILILWDLSKIQPCKLFNNVSSFAISNSNCIYSDIKRNIIIYNFNNNISQTITGSVGPLTQIVCSKSGRKFITCDRPVLNIYVENIEKNTYENVERIHTFVEIEKKYNLGPIMSFVFSDDEDSLYLGDAVGQVIKIDLHEIDLHGGNYTISLIHSYTCISLSDKISESNAVYDLASDLHVPYEHYERSFLHKVVFSPYAKYFLNHDDAVINTETSGIIRFLKEHTVWYSNNEKYFLSKYKNDLLLGSLENGKPLYDHKFEDEIELCCFLNDKTVVVVSQNEVVIWNVLDDSIDVYLKHDNNVSCILALPDNKHFLLGCKNGRVLVYCIGVKKPCYFLREKEPLKRIDVYYGGNRDLVTFMYNKTIMGYEQGLMVKSDYKFSSSSRIIESSYPQWILTGEIEFFLHDPYAFSVFSISDVFISDMSENKYDMEDYITAIGSNYQISIIALDNGAIFVLDRESGKIREMENVLGFEDYDDDFHIHNTSKVHYIYPLSFDSSIFIVGNYKHGKILKIDQEKSSVLTQIELDEIIDLEDEDSVAWHDHYLFVSHKGLGYIWKWDISEDNNINFHFLTTIYDTQDISITCCIFTNKYLNDFTVDIIKKNSGLIIDERNL